MTRHIRFTLDSLVPLTANDGDPRVLRGVLHDDHVHTQAGESFPFAKVRLLPCVAPSKIVCVGRNYAEHAKELGNEVPKEPLIFLKPPSSLTAHGAAVRYPSISKRLDYEGEVGVVVGRRAHRIGADDYAKYVAGYTAVNDVTARDIQKSDGQWTRGKGYDTFCPVGPWWVPKEEIDFNALRVITRLNGAVKQDAPVTDMLFGVGQVLAYVSSFMTLEPGDLIATGTPPGVSAMQVGDCVEVEVVGLGTLMNTIEAGE